MPPKNRASGSKGGSPTTSGFVGFGAFAVRDEESPRKSSQRSVEASSSASCDLTLSTPRSTTRLSVGAPSPSKVSPFYEGEDTELQMALKRLGKRDRTTKTKALQELLAIVQSSRTPAELRPAVAHFLHFYGKLLLDNNRRVREMTNTLLYEWISKQKKIFIVHMKEFLPDLWVTMHDAASREAATAARKAFDVAFPAEQGVEALTRCSQVILKSIQSNLNATPESILELAKAFVSDAASEAEDCYDRTVESSLIALSRFIHLLPTEENEKLCQEKGGGITYISLLSKKMWRLCSSKKGNIRNGTYILVAVVCRKIPQIVQPNTMTMAINTVFGFTGEKIPSNHAAMWDALLNFSRTYPQLWSPGPQTDKGLKQFFNRLWLLLKDGYYGSGSSSYLTLLPLISAIPNQLISEYEGGGALPFFQALFDSLWTGLSSPHLGANSRVLVQCYYECLLFVATKKLPGDPELDSDSLYEALLELMMVPFMQAIEETSPLSSAVRKNVIQKSVENIVKFSLSATARGEEEGDTHASSFPPSSRVVKMAQQLLQRVNQRISEVIRLEFGAEREGRPPSALQVAMVLKQFGLALHQLPESKLPGVSSRILALVQRWTELCLTEVTDCLHANKDPSPVLLLLDDMLSPWQEDEQQQISAGLDSNLGDWLRALLDPAEPSIEALKLTCRLLRRRLTWAGASREAVKEIWNGYLSIILEDPAFQWDENTVEALCLFLEETGKVVRVPLDGSDSWQQGEVVISPVLDETSLSLYEAFLSHSVPQLETSEGANRASHFFHLCLNPVRGQHRGEKLSPLFSLHTTEKLVESTVQRLKDLTADHNDSIPHLLLSVLEGFFELMSAQTVIFPPSLSCYIIPALDLLLQLSSTSEAVHLQAEEDEEEDDDELHSPVEQSLAALWRTFAVRAIKAQPALLSELIQTVNERLIGTVLSKSEEVARISSWADQLGKLLQLVSSESSAGIKPASCLASWPVWQPSFWRSLRSSASISSPSAPTPSSWYRVIVFLKALMQWEDEYIIREGVLTELFSMVEEPSDAAEVLWEAEFGLKLLQIRDGKRRGALPSLVPLLMEGSGELGGELLIVSSEKVRRTTEWSETELQSTAEFLGELSQSGKRQSRDLEDVKGLSLRCARDVLRAAVQASNNVAAGLKHEEVFSRAFLPSQSLIENALMEEKRGGVEVDSSSWKAVESCLVVVRELLPVFLSAIQPLQRRDLEGTSELSTSLSASFRGAVRLVLAIEGDRWLCLDNVLRIDYLVQWVRSEPLQLVIEKRIFTEKELEEVMIGLRLHLSDFRAIRAQGFPPEVWLGILRLYSALLEAIKDEEQREAVNESQIIFFQVLLRHCINLVGELYLKEEREEKSDESVPLVSESRADNRRRRDRRWRGEIIEEICQGLDVLSSYADDEAWEEQLKTSLSLLPVLAIAIANDYSASSTPSQLSPTLLKVLNTANRLHHTGLLSPSIEIKEEEKREETAESLDVVEALSAANCSSLYAVLEHPGSHEGLELVNASFLFLRQMAVRDCSRAVVDRETMDEDEEGTDDKFTRSLLPPRLLSTLLSLPSAVPSDTASSEVDYLRLFHWWLLLEYIDSLASATPEGRTALISFIKGKGVLSPALGLCSRYIRFPSSSSGGAGSVSKQEIREPELQAELSPGSLELVSGYLFYRTVKALPVMVRQWWSDTLDRNMSTLVARYVQDRVFPAIFQDELTTIAKARDEQSWDQSEMTVRGSRVSREVIATYVKEDCSLEIVIRLPMNYPLRLVEVECTKRLGVTEERWRRWLLQIVTLLSHQDGSILDAVLLWKENVDKEFQGIEACPICYSIVHPKTHNLPKLQCRVCSNKYHKSCLYKWFTQSGKSKCPICQQPFY